MSGCRIGGRQWSLVWVSNRRQALGLGVQMTRWAVEPDVWMSNRRRALGLGVQMTRRAVEPDV